MSYSVLCEILCGRDCIQLIRIVLCDDDNSICLQLQHLLDIYSFQNKIEFHISACNTLEHLFEKHPFFDLLFLDIRFQGNRKTGYDAAKRLRQAGINAPIIFLTSMPRYASRGYEVNAFRFLTKPIDKEKLTEALDAFVSLLFPNTDYIMVKSDIGQSLVDTNQLIFVETVLRKRQLVLADRQIITWEPLQSIYDKLPKKYFAYPQQSYIVNYRYIKHVVGSNITMSNGQEIAISRLNSREFLMGLHRIVEKKI